MGHPGTRQGDGTVGLIRAVPLPSVGPYRPANAYLLPDARVVVDPGPAGEATFAILSAALSAEGVSVADLTLIICTDAQPEHAGQSGALQAASGAPVAAHPTVLTSLKHGDPGAARRLLARTAAAAGVPPGLSDQAVALALPDAAAPGLVTVLADGATLELGRQWSVTYMPGPAPGNIGLFEPRSGAFLGGDLLERHGELRLPLQERDPSAPPRIEALVGSWRKIAHMPVDTIWPAHGPPIRALRVLVARRMAGLREQLRAARAAVPASGATVWEVIQATSGGVPAAADLNHSMGTTVALLEWHTARGTLERQVERGVALFRPASAGLG